MPAPQIGGMREPMLKLSRNLILTTVGVALIGGGMPGIALIGAMRGILSERGGCSTYQRKEGEFMD